MTAKKRNLFLLGLMLLAIGGILTYFYRNFRVEERFTSVPLSFDPYTCSSSYNWDQDVITVEGGFVKGKVVSGDNEELLVRALSPAPSISIQQDPVKPGGRVIRVENVNPLKLEISDGSAFTIMDYHTVSVPISLDAGEARKIEFQPIDDRDYLEFVVLGDNRDGYQTFADIIEQINAISPVFVIDNGDLVFGGKPNQYRLFYQTVSKLQVPLCTTLGNHDIRTNGRELYTELFGPPYYSFDFRNIHIIFLDSSRGWTEKVAIPEEQYLWLENDLRQAQGKQIIVVSHIPPIDPRSGVEPNILPDIPGVHETSYFERMMNDYTRYKNFNHAFPDPLEAKKFEQMMSEYHVSTVFLSHIHSYFSYLKDGVQYIISGGGGAELLTQNSYYHYIRVKLDRSDRYLEVVQLPSPVNTYQDRYIAALQLFANSVYKEYHTTILIVGWLGGIALSLLLWTTRDTWFPWLVMLGVWLVDVFKYAWHRFKELYKRFKARE